MSNKLTKEMIQTINEFAVCSKVEFVNSKIQISIYSNIEATLSDYMPILENFRFKIGNESHDTIVVGKQTYYVRTYTLNMLEQQEQIKATQDNIKAVLDAVLQKKLLNTELNSFSLLANFDPYQIYILTSIIAYEDQLLPEQNKSSISKTILKHPKIGDLFVKYFYTKFDPILKNREDQLDKLYKQIEENIKEVQNITDDKILNVFFDILKATTRTNFFKRENVFLDAAFAMKVDVEKLSIHLKGVQPRIETYVFHKRFRGLHLRRTKVSRGGLRWSDRMLDYRDEIKSLMQAQRSKNSVIIPEGAKGGFFITERDVTKESFTEIYSLYINAVLDMVDNYQDEKVVIDSDYVIYDDADPYFVVAADKGTSSMSDVANAISIQRGFWLGDAFASGGSKGFSHKDMGITAKGSIRSTERFFIENGINFYNDEITVVGIGSPAGDVFGNGIQLSKKFKLIAAIGSKEIFIDPNPNLENAFNERQRLFENGLGWSQYDQKLISKGGGIFNKKDKSIKLTPEIKELFGFKKNVVNGEELSRAVITAKVDLLFNGGVGTYVRGNDESDSQIGDKPNESIRVCSNDIKAYAVCEGGNLGFTQKARVDFAKKGGKINADSIDNSAGVHTSDYEVNLKIILNTLLDKKVITEENRIEVLHNLEEDVSRTVLWTNYLQSLSLSLDELRSEKELGLFRQSVHVLENNIHNFVAKQYEIPIADFHQVLNKNNRIIRPVLSVMLSFAKMFVKRQILDDKKFLESSMAMDFLYKYFPKSFDTLYSKEVAHHPLKNEIIATSIANMIINTQGSSFVADYEELGKANFMLKVKAFIVLNEIVSANDIRHEIYREDYSMDYKQQYKYLLDLEETLLFLTYWIIEHGENEILIFERTHEYQTALKKFIDQATPRNDSKCKNETLGKFFCMLEYIRMLTTMIKVKEDVKHDFFEIANIFMDTTKMLYILELNSYVLNLEVNNVWEERLQKRMLKRILRIVSNIIDKFMHFKRINELTDDAMKEFISIHDAQFKKYKTDFKALKESGSVNFTNLSVVVGTLERISL